MPLSPQQCRPAPLAALDKTCRRQPPGAPRTNLNNPEQIRTNPNTPKRPDQIGKPPESPQNTRKKTNPEHPRTPPLSRHSCAGRNHPTHQATRTKHLPQENSSLPPFRGEVRWGVGGTDRPPAIEPKIPSPLRPPSRHSCAGRNHSTHQATRTKHLPQENSSLPPFRGEVRWGVGGTDRPPAIEPKIPSPLRPPLSSFLRRQEPARTHANPQATPSPIHPSPLLGGRLGGGWEAPIVHQRSSRRFRHPCAPYLAANVFAAERYSVKPNRWGNSPVRSRM